MFGDTIANLYNNALSTFGNQTGLGVGINALGGVFGLTPKDSQLIGTPSPQQSNTSNSTMPNLTDEHLQPADANGIRKFSEAGIKYLMQNLPKNQLDFPVSQSYIPGGTGDPNVSNGFQPLTPYQSQTGAAMKQELGKAAGKELLALL